MPLAIGTAAVLGVGGTDRRLRDQRSLRDRVGGATSRSSGCIPAALKHIVIVDVLTIAVGFVLRATAGAVAIDVEISHWLLVCTILLALFIALAKRRHELMLLTDGATSHRPILSEYSPYLLDQMIAVVTASTLICVRVLYDQPGDPAEIRDAVARVDDSVSAVWDFPVPLSRASARRGRKSRRFAAHRQTTAHLCGALGAVGDADHLPALYADHCCTRAGSSIWISPSAPTRSTSSRSWNRSGRASARSAASTTPSSSSASSLRSSSRSSSTRAASAPTSSSSSDSTSRATNRRSLPSLRVRRHDDVRNASRRRYGGSASCCIRS